MAETLLNNQQETKLEGDGASVQRKNTHFKRIAGIVFSIIMIALAAFVLHLQNQNYQTLSQSTEISLTSNGQANHNYRTYVDRYKETKVELDETTRKLIAVNNQLDQVTTELATTKGMLTQTQGMLVEAQEENLKLKQELQGLDHLRSTENVDNMAQLQAKIDTLKEKNSQVGAQLTQLKQQLRAFEADFSNPQEGRSLISLFQSKIRLVKSHMNYLKQQAYYTKVAAQKEKDRLAVLNGNNGFIVKDGQLQKPDGTKKTFAIDVKIEQ